MGFTEKELVWFFSRLAVPASKENEKETRFLKRMFVLRKENNGGGD